MPSTNPTPNPAKLSTAVPTSIPTNWPTLQPNEEKCDDCYKYWTKLIDIKQDDDSMSIRECKHKKRSWWNSNLDEDSGDDGSCFEEDEHWNCNRNKCAVNGWGQKIQRRLGDEYDCESKERVHDDTNTQICLTYKLVQYADCGDLQSVFLPLCHDNMRIDNVKPEDMDAIISNVYPKSITVKGIYLYDEIGVNVEFNHHAVDQFVLCLKNVSINGEHRKYLNEVTVSNWVVFGINGRYEGCTNSFVT